MASPLVNLTTLETWVRSPITNEEFATEVLEAASLLVRDAGDPAWTAANCPDKAKLICLLVAKRTYINPDGEVRTNVGPLGATVTELQASGMMLSEAERLQIAALAPEVQPQASGLWVQPLVTDTPSSDQLYLFDSSMSDWAIPYIDDNDPVGQRVLGVIPDEG